MTWHESVCSCGARWRWYGRPEEATFLRRLFEREHSNHARRT